MAEYTPTTKELRDEYVYGQLDRATSPRITKLSLGGEFDRWLAQHDAEVAAKALEDAADEFEAIEQRYAIVHSPVAWLRERADRTRDGAR